MHRNLMSDLIKWKDSTWRKPLILNGARQVGKTWLLKEFGKTHFKNVAYVSLDQDERTRAFFEGSLDPKKILVSLALYLDMDVSPDDTLVILDEIQACPAAITALKYFCEDARDYHVAAAGSLLGISSTYGSGFPVGKVDMLDLYPMTFSEFLGATGNERFAKLIASSDWDVTGAFAGTFQVLLRTYYVVGGMPEAVQAYAASGNISDARSVQTQILNGYLNDFAKHIPSNLLARTMLIWDSIPKHLSKENKKFIFGQVREGARAANFVEALRWLEQAGLIHTVRRVSKPALPLQAYADSQAFKVFLLDVGLLGAMSQINPASVLDGNRVFTEFKGALTEQYVCQELIASCGLKPFYWSAQNSSGEIDFLVQMDGSIYPIEAKAEENLRAKSLRAFNEKYAGMKARRFSMSGYRVQDWMINVPLWAIGDTQLWQ